VRTKWQSSLVPEWSYDCFFKGEPSFGNER